MGIEQTVDKMIGLLETNISEEYSLIDLSRDVGYSPYYVSTLFRRVTGTTIKSYTAARRLTLAALEIRDTDNRIIDISIKYGFSSQQSFTRAFVFRYGCTPATYRKKPTPIKMHMKKEVLFPRDYKHSGGKTMSKKASVNVVYIPEHKYMCVRDINVQSYWPFWEGRSDCEEICGIIDSLNHVEHPIVACHTAGWYFEGEKRGYTYGVGFQPDYAGIVPQSFEMAKYEAGYYISFCYPPFDFLTECDEAVDSTDKMALEFNPEEIGYRWDNENRQCYIKMFPETLGYEILRPVVKI